MTWNNLEPKATRIRETVLGLLDQVSDEQKRGAMPPPGTGLVKAREALRNPEVDVVVCGEVKRGKSTFINALLGKELLPTGVRETTSQVFRVSHAVKESFALIFEDGHREPITEQQLARYGSQTAADQEGEPMFRGRNLRWIEVNTPAAFLPEGVHLVDTPGLGALYARHGEITHRYILKADAVIFVLDSDQPMTQPEKAFLEKVHGITPNVLYIQTKIDMKDESAWQEIRARNEKLLKDAFGAQAGVVPRVYPVASNLLFRAAAEKDVKERGYLVEDSLFNEARTALEAMIYRAAGWTRSAWGAAETLRYVKGVLPALDEQRRMLKSESAAEQEGFRKAKENVRAGFQAEWGETGTKRKQFAGAIDAVLRDVRQEAYGIGGQGTPLYARFSREINDLGSRDQAVKYAADLPDRVRTAVTQEWEAIVVGAHRQIARLDEDLAMALPDTTPVRIDLTHVTLRDPSLWDRVKAVNIDTMIGGGMATLVASMILTGGWATALVVAGGITGAFQGFGRVSAQQIDAARNELRQKLNELLAQCRNALCTSDLKHGQVLAPVDAFLDDVRSKVEAATSTKYGELQNRLMSEEQRLEAQSRLKGDEKRQELAKVDAQIALWVGLQQRSEAVVQELKGMQAEIDRMVAA